MIKMINRTYGTEMWVAEDRLDEYLAAGHSAADAPAVEKPTKSAERKQERKRAR